MKTVRTLTRGSIAVLMAAGAVVWYACADRPTEAPTVPAAPVPSFPIAPPDLRRAIAAQERHTDAVLEIPGVVGTAVATLPDGRAAMMVLVERAGIAGLPTVVDGVPVTERVTGRLMAFSDPTKRQRPAPMGFSVGHPLITAGTIGARVRDASGRVYILSNNHVLANSNGANIGDAEYQPGPFDGGTSADQIATLTDFQTIAFGSATNNTIDAAIALSSTAQLDNSTPTDDAYGWPNPTIYGDANNDGLFDNPSALLGLNVQKYGRTTRLTHGQITGVNATVTVCYEVSGSSCTKTARFVDQLLITPGNFSGGGDSGSLIVTDDANLNPVALLFAGSSTTTIGNRIDLVLQRFNVTIDGVVPPPPGPLTDVAVISVSAPAAVVVHTTASISVIVKNVGNQTVSSTFSVTLRDATENVTVGSQSVAGLQPGASATLTFNWTPNTTGDHSLVGSHNLTDDRSINDQKTATITVNPPVTDVAVTGLNAPGSVIVGHSVNVGVTVANVANQDVPGDIIVTLKDSTDGVTLGTQTINGLVAGASTTLAFPWNTTSASLGGHILIASHNFSDNNLANNRKTAVVVVNPKPTDIATIGITAPPSVFVGDTAHVMVTVKNVGEVDVTSSFAVDLTDGFGGAPVATGTVSGLAVGATTTVDLPWITAGVATGVHTMFATQKLPDNDPTNNSIAIAINVKVGTPPPPPTVDVAVTGVNPPGTVTQGSTVTVGVTIQNVSTQADSTSFNVVLTDSTAGVTIGTQTITTLAAGASSTLSFSWNTTNAALGGHTLVATHNLSDASATNNRNSATVTVNPRPTDVGLTGITAPPSVFVGDTAHVVVTVQNVGQMDVTTSFAVDLTDGFGGVPVATRTVAGLAVGATITVDLPWATAGVATGVHTMFATQKLVDNDPTNNSIAIAINVKPPAPPPTPDIAVTGVSAPATVIQGTVASVGVTVQNVGGVNVTSNFDVVLTDATAGVTIGTQTVAGLPLGASTTRTFSWNTASAVLGGHTLVATQSLADANAANNQASTAVTVSPPPIDIAVTSVNGPGSVTQGNTASIGVTVQNVGGQAVGSFNVVLTDATAGVTLGSQTVSGLAVNSSTTRNFNWNTTGASLGSHTLVATQSLQDDNAGNNQRSIAITVNPKPTDIALTGITAPPQATQGDTVPVVITVFNAGGVDVGTSFNVDLTDGSAGGVTVGTQSVAGLAVGASTTVTIRWATAGAAITTHTLIAIQRLPDNDPTNNSIAIGVNVNSPSLHVGNLDGTSTNNGNNWSATVQITAHDSRHSPVSGVLVHGIWNGVGSDWSECTTGANGICSVVRTGIANSTRQISFAPTAMTRAGYVYQSAGNHDPDGSSNGFSVVVTRK